MKQVFLVILAMCAFAAAMLPRERRALNPEEEEERQQARAGGDSAPPPSTTAKPKVCQPSTPCAWSTYRPPSKYIDGIIQNKYCICSSDKICKIDQDDTSVNAYVHRCREPTAEDLATEAADAADS